ncbi:hypothetical protein WJX77_010562 [Trebouxia sp. C0004]
MQPLLCSEGVARKRQAPTAAREGTFKVPFPFQLCGPAAETDLLTILLPYTDQPMCPSRARKTPKQMQDASVVRNETIWQYGSGRTTGAILTALLKDDKFQKGAEGLHVMLKCS